jgi:hypothetical protein
MVGRLWDGKELGLLWEQKEDSVAQV